MQLVEAVILLFVGLVPGVWATLVDVYSLGAPAFSTRIALLLLLVVLLATNARYRRQATWASGWLSLGLVESYYLSSAYTFTGMSRSAVVPLALLSVAGAGVAWVSWTAKHERGTFGLALKALVLVATLVACVMTHGGLGLLDVVCTVAIAYCLFAMRSRRVALERHRPQPGELASTDARPAARDAARSPRQAASPARQARPRPRANGGSRASLSARGGSSGGTARTAGAATKRPARTERGGGSKPSGSPRDGASGRRTPHRGGHGVTALQLRRSASPSLASGGHGGASARSHAHGAKQSAAPKDAARAGRPSGSRPSGQRAAAQRPQKRSGRPAASKQRPTKRTGGAVPEASRMRGSSADGRSRSSAKPHRRTGSSPHSHR